MKRAVLVFSLFCGVLISALAITNPYLPQEKNASLTFQEFLFDDFEIREVYFERSEWISSGAIPYKDVLEEYPQLGVLYISLPRLIAGSPDLFLVVALVVNAIMLVVVGWELKGLFSALHLRPIRLVALLLPSVLFFSLSRYDIFAVALVLGSVLLLSRKKFRWALLMLSFAVLAKWYAVLYVPFFLWYATRNGASKKEMWQGLYFFFGVLILVFLFTLFFAGQNALAPYVTHISRSLEAGSFPTVLARGLFASLPGLNTAGVVQGLLALFSLLQFLPLLLGVGLFKRLSNTPLSFDHLLRLLFGATLIFVLASKFYSSQWELWWLPFALLIIRKPVEWILLVAISLLNYLQAPVLFTLIGPNAFWFDVVVVIRVLLSSWLYFLLLSPACQFLQKAWRDPINSQNAILKNEGSSIVASSSYYRIMHNTSRWKA